MLQVNFRISIFILAKSCRRIVNAILFLGFISSPAFAGQRMISKNTQVHAQRSTHGSFEKFNCVGIYYDQGSSPKYWMGKTYSQFLQNLLGHFPRIQQVEVPIEKYNEGSLDRCKANFYIGSYFNNPLPSTFIKDLEKSESAFLWMGYNLWQLPENSQKNIFGIKYKSLSTLSESKDKTGNPGYFKFFSYKNETFFKYGKYSKEDPSKFVAPFEIALLDLTSKDTQVLSVAEHSTSGEKSPYITSLKNKYYVADVPFSFLHEADRYLIVSDLLFDVLNEKPLRSNQKRLALLRIEDIHPLVPLQYLWTTEKVLREENIPMNISLIPIFADPFFRLPRQDHQEFLPLELVPEFVDFIHQVKSSGGSMIWHGSTHQLDHMRNPHSGTSGDDFEFWDANGKKILERDSVDFVMNRLEAGYFDLQASKVQPKAWLTPHYQASPLDYVIFGKIFPWNVGRVIYFNLRSLSLPKEFFPFNYGRAETQLEKDHRRNALNSIKIDADAESPWSGQFFPYEIYGDVYGQKIIPENLGNSQPTENEHVVQPRSVEEILADAKRNRVIRDAWGSLFYHVQLFNTDSMGGRGTFPGDPSELQWLLKEMKKLGYQFISVDEFIGKNNQALRPKTLGADFFKSNSKNNKIPTAEVTK